VTFAKRDGESSGFASTRQLTDRFLFSVTELINDSFCARCISLFLSLSPFRLKTCSFHSVIAPRKVVKRLCARVTDGEQRDFNEIHFVPSASK